VARGRAPSRRASGEAGGRVPPHDLEAEKAILSALLLDAHAIDRVIEEKVGAEDFYHPAHQAIFAAAVVLKNEREPIDLHTLTDCLRRREALEAVGGPVALAELADYEATAANVGHHARIVRDKSIKRKLIAAAAEIAELSYQDAERAEDLLDAAESQVFEITQEAARDTFRTLQEELQAAFDYVEALKGHGLTGVATGFRELDEKTGGLQAGDLVILAARPSMGKTALALNIARNASVIHHKRVAIFSLEMTAQALVLRLLAAEAEIDASRFRSGYISVHDLRKLQQGAGRLSDAAMWIDDSGVITILEMKSKCRRLAADPGLDLVIVDYLQLAHGDGRAERREQEISEISRGLKALAKELRIPVIALSQLNRGPENRSGRDKRPILADLRESGAIEQDADLIAFIYRDHVYHEDADPEVAELIIAKQRNGPTGTIELTFQSRMARFLDRSGGEGGPGGAPPPAGAGFVPPDEPVDADYF
jgi:replicative DNA helicase